MLLREESTNNTHNTQNNSNYTNNNAHEPFEALQNAHDNQTDAESEQDQLEQTDTSHQLFAVARANDTLECVEASGVLIFNMGVVCGA